MAEYPLVKNDDIQRRIDTIRGVQVMLDSDLAEFYGVNVKRLNEQVKRNIERFPQEFRFQLTTDENYLLGSQIVTSDNEHNLRCQTGASKNKSLKSQFATSNTKGGRRYLPLSFWRIPERSG